jgi:phosphomannomutase
MAYVLDGLAAKNKTIAQWANSLPQYTIVKQKLTCPREKVALAASALRRAYADAQVQDGDGLRLDWSDRWVQVRGSNTEPIVRIIAEAPDSAQAHELCRDAVRIVGTAVGIDG